MSLQAVTPEELDAWLQSTEVTEEEEEELDAWLQKVTEEEENEVEPFERMQIDAPSKTKNQHCTKYERAWHRCSSLDEDNISSRPCFGVDAIALLAESQEEMDGRISPFNHVEPYLKSPDGQSETFKKRRVTVASQGEISTSKKRRVTGTSTESSQLSRRRSSQFSNRRSTVASQGEISTSKKRRVTGTSTESSQFSRRRSSQFSNRRSTLSLGSSSSDAPYFRRVTEHDSLKLDQEARFSRHASQFSVTEHTMDEEARFSRRSSQITVSRAENAQGAEAFLRAMEVSEQSHKMLMNHKSPMPCEERARSEAMRQSEKSRSALVRLSIKSFVKSIYDDMKSTGIAMPNHNNHSCDESSSMNAMKDSNQHEMEAGLLKMAAMLRAEQERQLKRIRSEFRS